MAEDRSQSGPPPPVSAPADPDDNMDDLDDLLDDFDKPILPPKPPQPYSDKHGSTATGDTANKDVLPGSDELSKELEAGMAQLLTGLDDSPEFAQEFNKLMKELDHQNPTTKDPAPKATKPDPIDKDDVAANFQATIEQTLKRMQESKLESEKPRKSAEAEDDVLAQMFKAMSSQGTLPDPGGDDDFSKMLLTVMEQLTNKEILYEPMKEIHDGYPDWMVKHEATEKPEDMKRYREQQQVVSEIVARFERKEYSDESPEDREYIVERMQKMQAAGSPPADLVGDMGEAKNILESMDSGCAQQ